MTREERLDKLKGLRPDELKDIIVRCHEILDRAGIDGAERKPCDDPACFSHLTHRLHEAVSQLARI